MPQTVLRFPVWKIEIVTGYCLILTHTHFIQALFSLFVFLETHTVLNKVNKAKTHHLHPAKGALMQVCCDQKFSFIEMIYICYSGVLTLLLKFHFVLNQITAVCSCCCWRSLCSAVLLFLAEVSFSLDQSTRLEHLKIEHLFNTPYLEINPPMIPL